MWQLAVVAVSAVAAAWDLRWRRIPRWLTAPAFLAGLLYHAGAGGLGPALVAAGAGLGLGLVLVALGACGGGDCKLLAAMGAMLGWHLWIWSVALGFMAAALVGLAQLGARGRWAFLAADLGAIMRGWRRYGLRPHPEHNIESPGAATAPFAVALGIGVACALLFF